MRDPNRLDDIYSYFYIIHKEKYPDLRFMQFIMNFQKYLGNDMAAYYLEDDILIKCMREYVEEIERGKFGA